MTRSRKKSLSIAAQANYLTNPSANGSGFTPVPTLTISDPVDTKQQLPTERFTSRAWPTAPETGPDGATLSFETELIGLHLAAGDGVNAVTIPNDWLHLLLQHAFGNVFTTPGEGAVTATASTLQLDGDSQNVHDLVPVFEAGIPSGLVRTQWGLVTSDDPPATYGITPNWVSTPTGAAVAYGVKRYEVNEDNNLYLAAAVVDDDVGTYLMLGGRVTGLRISAPTGQIARATWDVRFDTKVEASATLTALPAPVNAPVVTPLKSLLSPFMFNGTYYDTAGIEFDAGLETAPIAATSGANGRSGDEVITARPSMRVTPLRQDALLNLKRDVTQGPCFAQLGGGVLAGGVLNTMAIGFGNAYVSEATAQDDQGHARQALTIMASDPGNAGRFMQVVRA